MGKLLHAEEVEISDEALAVAIDDVFSEHVSMVLCGNSSAQALIAEHSFGYAVRSVRAQSQPTSHPPSGHREWFRDRNRTPSRLPPVDRQPAPPHAREGGGLPSRGACRTRDRPHTGRRRTLCGLSLIHIS